MLYVNKSSYAVDDMTNLLVDIKFTISFNNVKKLNQNFSIRKYIRLYTRCLKWNFIFDIPIKRKRSMTFDKIFINYKITQLRNSLLESSAILM